MPVTFRVTTLQIAVTKRLICTVSIGKINYRPSQNNIINIIICQKKYEKKKVFL